MSRPQHTWNYFRAGGVVQVDLKTTEDLLNLGKLDQKLWMALAMPTRGLSSDSRTLDYIDSDLDGRIRPPELIAAIQWLETMLRDPGILLQEGDSIALDQFKDDTLRAGAQRALLQLGLKEKSTLSIDELDLAVQKFSAEVFNGDGIIVADASQDEASRQLIGDIIQNYASVIDRSGQSGIDEDIITKFFADLEARSAWFAELDKDTSLLPLGLEKTALAFQATAAVADKIEDYFTRCRWVAFDPRSLDAANRLEADFSAIAGAQLTAHSASLATFPLAAIGKESGLQLGGPLNPAWQKPMQFFIETAVQAILGQVPEKLQEEQWRVIQAALMPYSAWRGREPQSKIAVWDIHRVHSILLSELRQSLARLISLDLALAPEFASLALVQKALLYRRDLGKILRNFINFSDFYRRQGAIFQTGCLFIDGRATELCIEVTHPARHATMAGLSGAYLVYCDLARAGKSPRSIVALMTDGDSDNLMIGRNGVFYDREGLDWDATISKIIANPISLREAFWLPYRKLARFIEEQVAKRAASAETSSTADLTKTAETVANVDKSMAHQVPASKKIDVGTVAAMGVALGSISTFFALMFSKFIDLGVLMPFGIVALILLISGPSMVLAFLKLKNRNLGPILDANGWAINTVARINVPFAASMTALRTVPLRAEAFLSDPYAERQRPWKLYLLVMAIGMLALAWALGKGDRVLPEKLRSSSVFGAALKLPDSKIPSP